MAGRIGSTSPRPMNETTAAKATAQTALGWAKNPPATPPKVPVYETYKNANKPEEGMKLSLAGDGHHTFVAAMKTGQPIELQKVKMAGGVKMPNANNDWKDFKYDDFNKGDPWKK